MTKTCLFIKRLLPVFLIFLLFSCSQTGIIVNNEPASDENAESVNDGASFFEQTQVLAALMELPYPISYYDAGSVEAYKNIINEITAAFPSLKTTNALNSYIKRLLDIINSMGLALGDVPRVYVLTDSEISDDYARAEIMIVDVQGKEYSKGTAASIKLRGNSTRGADKKPYTIKFEDGVSLLGMERSKKWVLLANAFDKTLLRNKMALDFAQRLDFTYSPECEYTDVYINSKYMGLYMLSEAVNEGNNRVELDTDNGDFLLEHESDRNESGKIYVSTKQGMRFKICEPKSLTAGQLSSVRAYMLEIEAAIVTGEYDEFSRYIDVPSFIDYYVMMEFFKDVDGWYSSVYFYLKDGVIHAGPVWDFDLSCGNASKTFNEDKYRSYWNAPGYGTGSGDSADAIWMQFGWFNLLMQNTRFNLEVREKFLQLQPYIKNLYEDNELGQNRINALIVEYRDAIERNNELWDITKAGGVCELKPFADYRTNVEYFRDWLSRRNTFLLNYFGLN